MHAADAENGGWPGAGRVWAEGDGMLAYGASSLWKARLDTVHYKCRSRVRTTGFTVQCWLPTSCVTLS